MTVFPDAEYLVLASRLIPDHDGGFALATLARARQMAASGVHDGLGHLLKSCQGPLASTCLQ